jgi:hypothetical protein
MDYWRRSSEMRARAWDYLRDQVRPDVALVQEANPAGNFAAVVYRPGGIRDDRAGQPKDLGWGSAVVSFGPPLRPLEYARSPFHTEPTPLLRTFPGSVAVAEIESTEPLVVVSAYGLIDRGYADTTMHRILSDLTPLVDERLGRRMVIAGDLNVTSQWSVKHRSTLKELHKECLARDLNLFERFTSLGFQNLVVRTGEGPLLGCECSAGYPVAMCKRSVTIGLPFPGRTTTSSPVPTSSSANHSSTCLTQRTHGSSVVTVPW